MALFCTKHRAGPLDVWYDCDDCCQGDKAEAITHIRRMKCADYKALRLCRWCASHKCWSGEEKCTRARVQTEYGVAREIDVIAAKRLFDDATKSRIGRTVAVQRAKHLEKVSPVAAALLKGWMQKWNTSYRGLSSEEIPDTDDEF